VGKSFSIACLIILWLVTNISLHFHFSNFLLLQLVIITYQLTNLTKKLFDIFETVQDFNICILMHQRVDYSPQPVSAHIPHSLNEYY